MEGFVDKILKHFWGEAFSIPIIVAISGITGIPVICSIKSSFSYSVINEGGTYEKLTMEGKFAIVTIILFLICINAWYIIYVISNYYTRKAKKGKSGIIIYIDAPDNAIYKETRRKFGNEFEESCISSIDVVFAPWRAKNIEYRKQSIVKYLKRKRSLLYINIRVNVDRGNGTDIYYMKIGETIIHREYRPDIEEKFKIVFSGALKDFSKDVFSSDSMVKNLQIKATEMSLACQYVIGLSLFLNGEFDKSEEILSSLHVNDSIPRQKAIKDSSQLIRYDMNMILAQECIDIYQRQCDDDEWLEKANGYLEKAEKCGGKTYDYCLNKAYYYIAKEQNTKKAKEYVNICKQMKSTSEIWKYSEAFLTAYENRSIGSILSSYKKALKVEYNIQDLIVYIEMISQKQPDRCGLFLALGILYDYVGDVKLSRESIDKYLLCTTNPDKAKQILINKINSYKQ